MYQRLPKTLNGLFSEELTTLTFSVLLVKAKEVFSSLTCTKEQTVVVKELTREQRNTALWREMRTGRITASIFHQASHTNVSKPSKSLIKQICYGSNFRSAAIDWGCRHEKKALDHFRKVLFF